MTLWPIEEELFIKPSRTGRKWPVSDPMALAYSGINLKKEVVVVEEKLEEKKKKILKGKHKPCKNHPDKYAVKEGLCCKCYKQKYGKSPYFKEDKAEVQKVDEEKAVTADNNNTKITTKEGEPVVLPENWGTVDGVPFGQLKTELLQEAEEVAEIRSNLVDERKIYEFVDGKNAARIHIVNGTFSVAHYIQAKTNVAQLTPEDLQFIHKLSVEIKRLVGVL